MMPEPAVSGLAFDWQLRHRCRSRHQVIFLTLMDAQHGTFWGALREQRQHTRAV